MALTSFCTLPPELLLIIFRAACNDDDTTARSLASVSRSFYCLALPLIYRVLSVHNSSHLALLLEQLEREPSHASRVEHVLVADQGLGPTPDYLAFENALRRLWGFVAPTVQSLALLIHCQTRDENASKAFQTIFDTAFPCLTDLTICGDHPIPAASPPLGFPALRRFHTAGLTRLNPAGCFAPLTVSCPELTHIRVSMASESNITFAVAAALDLPGAPTDIERMCLDRVPLPGGENAENERERTYIPFPMLPRGLVSLVVKPAAPPMPLFAGATSMFYAQYLKQLEELVPSCPQGKMRLLSPFRRAMWEVEGYGVAEMKRDWIEAMRGDMGAWTGITI